MDEGRDQERGGENEGLGARLKASWPTLAALACAFAVLAVQGDFPVLELALALFAVAVVALLAAPSAAGPRRPLMPSRGAQPPVWPDTGMKMMLEALPQPAFLTDRNGVLRYANAAAAAAFGPSRPADPLSFKLRVPEVLAAVDRVGRGEAGTAIRFAERHPTERFFEASIAPVRLRPGEARVDFVLVLLSNRTEIVRMERMRGDFIANASHELRTPLASLRGFVETLLGPARADEVNRERFLKIMLEQAERMSRLIDDLLSLSRIEMRAHLRPETAVDLEEIARHVAATLAPLAAAHRTVVTVEVPAEAAGQGTGEGAREGAGERTGEASRHLVRGDRDELIQVVSNLVENAVKYGRDGGRVAVSLTREPGPDGTPGVQIAVADDGPGIDPEHLPRLTERFYRVDVDTSRARKGTGLGLAIVKHIVNRHRGRLAIRSKAGEGSVFSVWIESASTAGLSAPHG